MSSDEPIVPAMIGELPAVSSVPTLISACHGLDVACECRGGGLNDLRVVLVEHDGGGCSVVTDYREAARLLRVAHRHGVLCAGIACRQSRHDGNEDE